MSDIQVIGAVLAVAGAIMVIGTLLIFAVVKGTRDE